MNQILITKKLYVTPELKRKKKIYKIDFIVSVFLVVALISLYIYASYDRTKEEQIAQDILTSLSVEETGNAEEDDNVLVVALNKEAEEAIAEREGKGGTTGSSRGSTKANTRTVRAENGKEYTSVATINIPSINVKYPILLPAEQTTESIEKTLRVSPCKFWGPEINEVGNYCIVGHNYRNTKFFSKVPRLKNGAIIELTDFNGRKLNYKVYDKYTVSPSDVSCTTQLTNGRKEVTLITCTDSGEQRVIVRAREVK